MDRFARSVAAIAGASMVAFGLWGLFAAASFYRTLAVFPPYNEHFIHDIGAFMTGIGATLLFALAKKDAVLVALGGASVGAVLHAVAHIRDRGLGGRASDPGMSLLALILVGATLACSRASRS